MDRVEAARLLELKFGYTQNDVHSAYRRLSKRFHPDVGGDAEKFHRLTLARQVALRRTSRVPGQGRSAMKERQFQTILKKGFEENLGAEVFNVHGSEMQEPGWPDLQVYHPKWTGHLELKIAKNKLSQIQAKKLAVLCRRGTPAFCLRYDREALKVEDFNGEVICRKSPTTDAREVLELLIDATRLYAARLERKLWIYG